MRKILNYGSLNIDKVYSVEHFVRPGETISSLSYEVFPGGKGLNQSIAVSRAGGNVYHVGCVGSDGDFLISLLEKNNVDVRFVQKKEEPTGHAIIQVDETGQNCILLNGGSNYSISSGLQEKALENFGEDDILILQNEVNGNSQMIDVAAKKGLQIALNPSPYNIEIEKIPFEKIKWLLINEVEGKQLTGKEKPEEICMHLLEQYSEMAVVLTLGNAGVMYQDINTTIRQKAYKVPVVDTTAAGDTFTGYFLSAITADMEISKALELAAKASAITVSRKGAAVSIPEKKEVLEFEL